MSLFQIELEAILSLNQDLLPQNDNANIIPNKLSKVSRESTSRFTQVQIQIVLLAIIYPQYFHIFCPQMTHQSKSTSQTFFL